MTSLGLSPTTTKKLLFFSCTPLRMSVWIRSSLRGGAEALASTVRATLQFLSQKVLGWDGNTYTCFRDIFAAGCPRLPIALPQISSVSRFVGRLERRPWIQNFLAFAKILPGGVPFWVAGGGSTGGLVGFFTELSPFLIRCVT